MNAIYCEGLSKRYGQIEALKSLDLSVPRGSIFGFLGRNGAGKTTTIRLLTGLARPTGGRAWVDGVETTGAGRAGRARFGYLPEEPAFYTWMTPREYLDYVGRLFRLEERERRRRVEELLEQVDLQSAAKRRIAGFSRGMRQRLGLAQALVHRPPVLFLDEPASALDPAGRRDVLDLIASLGGQTTVFLSSHILADVERVCDTVAVIHEGALRLVAGREELLARYTANVARLEVNPAGWPLPPAFLAALGDQTWVISASLGDDNSVQVSVNDPAAARQCLLPLVIQHNVVLERYEWLRPTLEDVFLAISE
ncbi:MAG: ABC transporter ATP-binding protein [Chloroflexota bacterium]